MEKEKGSRFARLFRSKSIDQYFLTEKCPFSTKRQLKTGNIKIMGGVVLIGSILFILFAGGSAEQQWKQSEAVVSNSETINTSTRSSKNGDGSIEMGGAWGAGGVTGLIPSHGSGNRGGGTGNRQFTSSQIVHGGGSATTGSGLPMGSTLPVRLLNTLLSSDSSQPVMAEVLEDAVWRNSVLIPTGARVIGTASFDDTAKRLQIHFNTFVYPEGDQHTVSALALLSDGSSGLRGNYHSGTTQKEVGRFLSDFVGGLADGMKDRQAGGQAGIAFEPGSLRNGILNGVTVSSLNQAKSFSEGMQNVRPYLEVQGGTVFVLYFEKEYSP